MIMGSGLTMIEMFMTAQPWSVLTKITERDRRGPPGRRSARLHGR